MAGFTVGPGSDSTVLIRAVGPTLDAFGVPNSLPDPNVELYNGAGERIAENDDALARDAAMTALAGAFPLPPGSKDAALVVTLAPGTYTARVGGTGSGAVLLEIYAVSGTTARLVNLSVRARVNGAGDAVIPGLTIAPGSPSRRLLIRAIGPELGKLGVADPLMDPKLELFAGETRVSENDDWEIPVGLIAENPASLPAAFAQAGAFPLPPSSKEAAMVVTLAPGSYTLQVRGAGGGGGEVLVEIYEIPPVAPVTVQSFTIAKEKMGNRFFYRPQLQLIETTGLEPLTVVQLEFAMEEFGRAGRVPTWEMRKRMPAGSVQEIIDPNVYGAPEFEFDAALDASVVSLKITYLDGKGQWGSVSTFVLIPR